MNTVLRPNRARVLLAPLLMLTAAIIAPSAAQANCGCLCVDGAPYNVCTYGFTEQTRETTADCTAQLSTACPVPDPGVTGGDESETSEIPAPVNAAAREHGLNCKPRQVYRPDLAEHKVYTVCMPEAMENAGIQSAQPSQAKARSGRGVR